jgi:hypothetical protein
MNAVQVSRKLGGKAAAVPAGTIGRGSAERPGWKMAGFPWFAGIDSSCGSPSLLAKSVHPGNPLEEIWRTKVNAR